MSFSTRKCGSQINSSRFLLEKEDDLPQAKLNNSCATPEQSLNNEKSRVNHAATNVFEKFQTPPISPNKISQTISASTEENLPNRVAQPFNVIDKFAHEFYTNANDCQRDPKFISDLKIAVSDENNRNLFNSKNITKIFWVLALKEYDDKEFINNLISIINDKLSEDNFFTAQDLSYISLAVARFRYGCKEFIYKLKTIIENNLETPNFLNFNNLINFAYAFAKLDYYDEKFMNTLEAVIHDKLQSSDIFNGQDLVMITWILTKFETKNLGLINTLQKVIASKHKDPNFFDNQERAILAFYLKKFLCIDRNLISSLKAGISYKSKIHNCLNTEDIVYKFLNLKISDDSDPVLNQANGTYNGSLGVSLSERIAQPPSNSNNDSPSMNRVSQEIQHSGLCVSPRGEVNETKKSVDFVEHHYYSNIVLVNCRLIEPNLKAKKFFEILKSNFSSFDAVNISVFWDLLANRQNNVEWKISIDDPRLDAIKISTYEILEHLQPYRLARMTYALAKLGLRDKKFINALKKAIEHHLQKPDVFSSVRLADITVAFSIFGSAYDKFRETIEEIISSRVVVTKRHNIITFSKRT